MSDKPCTHCGGTGKEPDAIEQAYDYLQRLIDAGVGEMTPHWKQHLHDAAHGYQRATTIRIVDLEGALRDVLGRFGDDGDLLGSHQFLQAANDNITKWRAVLEGHKS